MNFKDFESATECLPKNTASFARCAPQAIRVATHAIDLCPVGADRQQDLTTSPAAFTPPARPGPGYEESEDEEDEDEEEEKEEEKEEEEEEEEGNVYARRELDPSETGESRGQEHCACAGWLTPVRVSI
jgi:hypothetical protein